MIRLESIVDLRSDLGLEQYQQLYASGLYQCEPTLRLVVVRMAKGNSTLVNVISSSTVGSTEYRNLAKELRQLRPPAGFQVYVGGLVGASWIS